MLNEKFLVATNAYATLLTRTDLSDITYHRVAIREIQKLLPLAEEGYTPAIDLLSIYHPDPVQKTYWINHAAARGNIDAIEILITNIKSKPNSQEQLLNLHARHFQTIDFHQKMQNFEYVSLEAYAARYQLNPTSFREKLAASTLSNEELALAHPSLWWFHHEFICKTDHEQQFLSAVKTGDLTFVRDYLASGGNPFVRMHKPDCAWSISGLYLAIKFNHLEILKLLIEKHKQHGLSLQLPDSRFHLRPIVFAAELADRKEHVLALLNAGVDPRTMFTAVYSTALSAQRHEIRETFLEARTERFFLNVFPFVADDDENFRLECFNFTLDADPDKTITSRTRFSIGDLKGVRDAAQVFGMTYTLKTIDGYADEDEFSLKLHVQNSHKREKFMKDIYLNFARVLRHNLIVILKENNINIDQLRVTQTDSGVFEFSLPRILLPLVVDYLFQQHQKHVLAVKSDKPLQTVKMAALFSDAVKAHINNMTPDYKIKETQNFYFGAHYMHLLPPNELDETIYRNYGEIRQIARMLAYIMSVRTDRLKNEPDLPELPEFVLIHIATITSNFELLPEDDAKVAARQHLYRPRDTLRLFSPKAENATPPQPRTTSPTPV